ncbi:MAG: hypothetical protein P8Z30_15825 [Acidobacteriota bacterium]
MRSLFQAVLLAGVMVCSVPLAAQQAHTCSDFSIVIGSPEDTLMTAVNAASDANAKISILEKFAQEHSDSTYMPCVNQLLTKNYVSLNQFDQASAAGQKSVAANYLDVSFLENLLRAYMGSGKVGNAPFDLIMKAAPQIKAETQVSRSVGESDAQYEAAKKSAMQQAKNDTNYMVYAFFRLLPQLTDLNQKIKLLDQFTQAYPNVAKEQAGRVNYGYALAYAQANQPQKADEYGEKAIAADPNHIDALNFVAYDYAVRLHVNQAKAEEYAQKVLTILPTIKKPAGVSDEAFKAQQDTQEGMARLTLGYIEMAKTSRSHKTGPAIKEFQQAADLLKANPELQGQAYYFLGYAYENLYPANHHGAMTALEHAAGIHCSVQSQARELLEKVRRAAR